MLYEFKMITSYTNMRDKLYWNGYVINKPDTLHNFSIKEFILLVKEFQLGIKMLGFYFMLDTYSICNSINIMVIMEPDSNEPKFEF